MSETDMNFGPDWLRALSDSGTTNTNKNNITYIYVPKACEHRYSKHEMLSLFDSNVKMQPKMKEFTGLISDKCQIPLSLEPMTEEEQRIWSKSVNSDVVMRLSNKTGSLNNQNGPSSNQLNNGQLERNQGNLERGNSLDNRGLNLRASGLRNNQMNDRGRGRPRTNFIRNQSYEDDNNDNNFSSTANNERRDYRSKNFDRSIDDSNLNQRENKPQFERQFSKPPPISNDNEQDSNQRLNFRNKPQSSSLDSQQQNDRDTSWRSNRERIPPNTSNLRNDNNQRRNLDWRNKYRSDETNNQSSGIGNDWKRNNTNNINNNNSNNINNNSNNNNTNNDRWRNDNELGDNNDNNLDRRRFFNNKSGKDKLGWENDEKRNSNLPEWSLDDDTVLDRKFGTFDASGQFREDPVDSFSKDTFTKDNNVSQSKTDDWFIKNDKQLESSNSNLNKDNEHHNLAKLIDDKSSKFLTNDLFNDLMGKTSIQHQQTKPQNDLHTNIDLNKDKFTNNFINSLINQRQSNSQNDNLNTSDQHLKSSNEKELNEFFDNFSSNNLNSISNQLNFGQLGFNIMSNNNSLNKNEQQDTDLNRSRILENLIESRNHQQQIQQKLNQPSQIIDSTNDKLTKLSTIGDKSTSNKSDSQNLLESIATKQQNFPSSLSSINPEFQKMFSLVEAEKFLKEMNKSNNSTASNPLNEQLQKQQQQQQQQQTNLNQLNKKNLFPNDNHQFNELNTGDNLVNQWKTPTDDDELKARQKVTIFPPNHELGQLWFYQDPQKKVQGPFSSTDMLEWYRGGYFTMDLLVRRGCDEVFSKLGELIEIWNRIPFIPIPGDSNPSPILNQLNNNRNPATTITSSTSNNSNNNANTINANQPQIPNQLNNPLSMILPRATSAAPQMPNQIGLFQIFPNQPEINFGQSLVRAPQSLVPQPIPIVLNQQQLQEKQQMLLRQMQQQQQQYMMDQSIVQAQLRQLLAQLKKNEQFANLPSHEQQELLIQHFSQNQQLLQQRNVQQPQPSNPIQQSTSSNQQQQPPAQQQARPNQPNSQSAPINQQQATPNHLSGNNETVDNSQLINSANSNLNMNPMIKQILANKNAGQPPNIWGLNGEQVMNVPAMSVTAIEEMQRQEQEKREIEEKRKIIELQEQERMHFINLEEERIRNREKQLYENEMLRQKLEEKLRKEEEEVLALETKRKEKEKELEEELIKKQLNKQKQIQQQQQQQQKFDNLNKQIDQKQEQQQIPKPQQQQKKKGWNITPEIQPSLASLDEIQKLQESTEREERRLKQTQQMLQMIQDQQQQNQKSKGWNNVTNKLNTAQPIKTLDEIQREESERMALLKKIEQENQPIQSPQSSTGVWSNAANNLNWKSGANLGLWGNQSELNENQPNTNEWSIDSSVSNNNSNLKKNDNFQQQSLQQTTPNKNVSLTNEQTKENSAFLTNNQQQLTSTNSNKKSKSKKEDEFSKWCTDALSHFQGISIDIPFFITFLKDVESPNDVSDYVFSYLGENKDSKEFAKKFIEKRSYYKNQAKKTNQSEEMIWGPAPAILPQNISNKKVEESEFSIFQKSGKKKKKNAKKNETTDDVK